MKKQALLGLLCLITTGVLRAEPLVFESGVEQNLLLELYTSEGCNSCPPAETRLNSFEHNPDLWKRIFPVAFHVDYWDYLGWKDPFAQPAHSRRQRQYAQARHVSAVYTPSFMVNGRSAGPRLRGVAQSNRTPGQLRAILNGQQLSVLFDSTSNPGATFELNTALVAMDLNSKITRGENRGRDAKHHFVALDHSRKKSSNGRWDLLLPESKLTSDNQLGIVVWVTIAGSLTPLQVTGGLISGR